MNIQEFEQIEKLKSHFRQQLLDELASEIGNLKRSDDNSPGDGSAPVKAHIADYQDAGYTYCKQQVFKLLSLKA